MIEQAITVDKALLISSTLPPKTAAALKALVDPAVEQLGGDEVVSDYEVEVPEAPDAPKLRRLPLRPPLWQRSQLLPPRLRRPRRLMT